MPVNPVLNGARSVATTQVTATTTSALLVPRRATRRAVGIYNSGSVTVYVGDPTVSSTTGHIVAASSFVGLPTIAELWVVAASSTATVSVIEVFD